jgi:protein YIPF1/2
MGQQKNTKPISTYSFFQIEYYQQYFNVTSKDVMKRVLGSMVPRLNSNYLLNEIKPNPDLYGPFWIAITLIFTTAIMGNIVSFFQNFGQPYTWTTDFHKGSYFIIFNNKKYFGVPKCLK